MLTTIVLSGGINLEKLLFTPENFNQRATNQTRLDTQYQEAARCPELCIDSLLQR